MISMIKENIIQKGLAAGMGLTGGVGSSVIGGIQSAQRAKYQKALNKIDPKKYQHIARQDQSVARSAVKGFIPLVGAGANLHNQFELDRMKKSLKKHLPKEEYKKITKF